MRTIIKSVTFRNRSRAVKTVRFREGVRWVMKKNKILYRVSADLAKVVQYLK